MGFFESLFYTIWRGLAIGILISAPMGPVGILCIQRTLYKGRKTGLYTGIGAAISDLFYCILTGFGLSFIEVFLERNQNIIQLVGSVVLIAFAVYLFKKNPASSLKTPQGETEQISPHKNILGGFLFTFSNPLILFLIIGLFARFNFSIPEISFYYYIAGYVAIFCGCVLWWQFVTYLVNKLRAHFNLRSMWLINRIIGVIILLFALVGIVTGITNLASAEVFHFNKGRTYIPFIYATSEGVLIDNQDDTLKYDFLKLQHPADEFNLSFRAKNINGDPSKKYKYITKEKKELKISNPKWGFFITGETDTIVVEIKGCEKVSAIESQPALDMAIYYMNSNRKVDQVIVDNISPFSSDNLFLIRNNSDEIEILAGRNHLSSIINLPALNKITGYGFFAGWGGKILISDINVDLTSFQKAIKDFSIDSLEKYLKKSKDPMEGYWTVFDRELEESLLKLGGNYTLACVKEGDEYSLLYISGARVNSSGWKMGDKKAILKSSFFPDIYNVEWYDAMKQPFDRDIQAQIGDGLTLTIQFPYQSSKLRLRKLPATSTTSTPGASTSKTTTKTTTTSTA